MERREANATIRAVVGLQVRRAEQERKRYDQDTDRRINMMQSRIRTLRYDEQAKAHTADSQAALVLHAAPLNIHAEGIEETKDGYLVPRRSLTLKLALALRAPLMEFETRVWKQLDIESKRRLEADRRAVMRAHPDHRAKLAARLAAETGPTLRYVEGSDQRLVWRSDGTLLIPWKIQTLATVKVKVEDGISRTFDQATETLPTWKDEAGNVVDPNMIDFDSATITQETEE